MQWLVKIGSRLAACGSGSQARKLVTLLIFAGFKGVAVFSFTWFVH